MVAPYLRVEARKDAVITVFKQTIRSLALPLLILPLVFLLGACQLEEVPSHVTYTYSITSLPKDRMTNTDDQAYTYRAGEQIDLSWTPHQGNDTHDTRAQAVRIDAGLVGPFATVAALKAAVSFDNNTITSGRVAATAPPIQTNDWTDKAVSTTLQLPTAPGYYMLVQRVLINNHGPSYPVPTGQILSILK